MKYKINGQVVSEKEWNEHTAQRKRVYGDLMAELLQARQAPGTKNTDRAFLEGMSSGLTHGIDPMFAEQYYARARKAGINPTGKVFISQLGRAEDPLAWVSDLSDVKKACIAKGHGCEPLGIKPVEKDPGPDIPLAADIVDDLAERRMEENPDLKAKIQENPKKLQELKEEVIDKHGARK